MIIIRRVRADAAPKVIHVAADLQQTLHRYAEFHARSSPSPMSQRHQSGRVHCSDQDWSASFTMQMTELTSTKFVVNSTGVEV